MSNHVSSRWLVEGAPADLDAFEQEALTPLPAPPGWLARLLGRAAPDPRARGLDGDRIAPPPAGLDGTALRDWRLAHWGTQWLEVGAIWDRSTPGRGVLRFETPWSPPDGLASALAPRLPPGLRVVGLAVEPGNELAWRFVITATAIRHEEVPFTAALYEEVTGEPLDEG